MSQNLTQPEEIDCALMEMAGKDMKAEAQIPDKKELIGETRKEWYGGYVSPYRAAHMKLIDGPIDS